MGSREMDSMEENIIEAWYKKGWIVDPKAINQPKKGWKKIKLIPLDVVINNVGNLRHESCVERPSSICDPCKSIERLMKKLEGGE